VHNPSHVAAVRTEVDKPYAPALHGAVQVDTERPVAEPYVPHAHKPSQEDVVRTVAAVP
jgi:hypothetical protein